MKFGIDRLLGDAETRRRYGAASRRIAVERFAIDRVLAATLNLYTSALHAGDPS